MTKDLTTLQKLNNKFPWLAGLGLGPGWNIVKMKMYLCIWKKKKTFVFKSPVYQEEIFKNKAALWSSCGLKRPGLKLSLTKCQLLCAHRKWFLRLQLFLPYLLTPIEFASMKCVIFPQGTSAGKHTTKIMLSAVFLTLNGLHDRIPYRGQNTSRF